jgi:D-alanyl-D-alanine carboxypeptidase
LEQGLSRRCRFLAKTLVLAALLAGLTGSAALAASHRHKAAPLPTVATPSKSGITPSPAGATDPDKDAALIIDGATGKVLYSRNETLERHPASLTKMMTLYLLFEALKQGKVNMQTQMPVSAHAQIQKPTKLYLRRGQTIDVDTAIRAIVIRSANDVAVVIAEALGGTESHFAEMMNEKARQMGMKETNYHNASGLPDPLQITTAMDLAVLARHVAYDFPQYYPYFGTLGFTYRGTFYPSHDNLVGRYPCADGIKTGYVGASGFNLATSVVRDGVHLIGIVMGGRTAVRRDIEMMHLMDVEFADIAANPTLVARGPVPWQAVASVTPPPAVAGFTLASNAASLTSQQVTATRQMASLSGPPQPQLSAVPPPALPGEADEDTAENHRAPDESLAAVRAEAPQLASAAIAPKPVPAVAAPVPQKPVAVAAVAPAKPQRVAVATTPSPRPQPAPSKPEPAKAEQVASATPVLRAATTIDARTDAAHSWVIQVGAYGNQALAQAELTSFVAKAKDIIGQAAPIVAPITSRNGHTLYRARFGTYEEDEARNVCSQLTQRGDSCFAVITR